MKQMTYCGPDTRITGATALVRDDPVTSAGVRKGLVLAQFDCTGLVLDGVHLAFGWHLFNRGDWK
jgi:hypothetical protein